MSASPLQIFGSHALPGDGSRPPLAHRALGFLARPRRVLFVLAAVWVLNLADLHHTLLEASSRHFSEMNPLAAWLLRQTPALLVAYKALLVGVGSSIMLCFRQHRLAELGCWFVLAVCAGVGLRWELYFDHVAETLSDPTVNGFAIVAH